MNKSLIDESQRKAARVAGFAYLVTLAVVVFANFGIFDRLNVAGNAAETARNILAHERLFRVGIVCNLVYVVGLVILLTALYVILRPVDQGLALLAAFWKLVYAMVWVLMTLNFFDVLRVLKGAGYLRVFETERLQALAKLYLSGGFDRYYAGLLFYALASTVSSYLWLRSSYIPKALAAWGVIWSAWCIGCTLIFLIFPDFSKTVNLWWFDSGIGLFEIAMGFWLLFKGLRPTVVS